jgi:hypothetical protein
MLSDFDSGSVKSNQLVPTGLPVSAEISDFCLEICTGGSGLFTFKPEQADKSKIATNCPNIG